MGENELQNGLTPESYKRLKAIFDTLHGEGTFKRLLEAVGNPQIVQTGAPGDVLIGITGKSGEKYKNPNGLDEYVSDRAHSYGNTMYIDYGIKDNEETRNQYNAQMYSDIFAEGAHALNLKNGEQPDDWMLEDFLLGGDTQDNRLQWRLNADGTYSFRPGSSIYSLDGWKTGDRYETPAHFELVTHGDKKLGLNGTEIFLKDYVDNKINLQQLNDSVKASWNNYKKARTDEYYKALWDSNNDDYAAIAKYYGYDWRTMRDIARRNAPYLSKVYTAAQDALKGDYSKAIPLGAEMIGNNLPYLMSAPGAFLQHPITTIKLLTNPDEAIKDIRAELAEEARKTARSKRAGENFIRAREEAKQELLRKEPKKPLLTKKLTLPSVADMNRSDHFISSPALRLLHYLTTGRAIRP